MNKFTKNDKAVLVVFIVLHVLLSSIARAAGIKMAASISLLVFSFLYLAYLLIKRKDQPKEIRNEIQGIYQPKRIFSLKLNHKLITCLVIVITIVFGFYWYELRPSQIKKDCYETATERAIKNADRLDDKFYIDEYNNLYKMCLQEQGL